jgi:hypothetical protein
MALELDRSLWPTTHFSPNSERLAMLETNTQFAFPVIMCKCCKSTCGQSRSADVVVSKSIVNTLRITTIKISLGGADRRCAFEAFDFERIDRHP